MKKETRNKISNQTGVTLIALVITIIVLIIIAGISIGTGISGMKQARENKNWELSDKLRDEINKMGYNIKDQKDGIIIEKL